MNGLNSYLGSDVARIGDNDSLFIICYNNLGNAVLEGSVYKVSYADSGTYFPSLATIATDASGLTLVGVVASGDSAGSNADKSWVKMQIRGYCGKVKVNAAVTDDHTLKVTNTNIYATTEGAAADTTLTFARAKSAATGAGFIAAYLYGNKVVV